MTTQKYMRYFLPLFLIIFCNASMARYLQPDPIGLNGGINPFVYANGNPVMNIDPLGLSPEDVAKIQKQFTETLNQMTKDGLRLPNPTENNWCRSRPWWHGCQDPNNYKDCGEQVDYVNKVLDQGKYDDHWMFMMDAGVGHAWGIATSSNPADPILYYDPREAQFTTGAPCPSCTGWFSSGGGYSPANPPIHPKP